MCPRAIALEEVPYSAPFPLSYTFNIGTSILATTSQPRLMEERASCLEKIDLLKKKKVLLIFDQKRGVAKDAKEKWRKRVVRSHGQFNYICFHKPMEIMSSSKAAAAAAVAPANIRVLVCVRPYSNRESRFSPSSILEIDDGGMRSMIDFGMAAATDSGNGNGNGSGSGSQGSVIIIDQGRGGLGGGYGDNAEYTDAGTRDKELRRLRELKELLLSKMAEMPPATPLEEDSYSFVMNNLTAQYSFLDNTEYTDAGTRDKELRRLRELKDILSSKLAATLAEYG